MWLRAAHLICPAARRLVCCTEQQSYPSLRSRLHSPTAAGVLSALDAALPAEARSRLPAHCSSCGVEAPERTALQELLLVRFVLCFYFYKVGHW